MELNEKTLASELAFDGVLLKLYRDQVELSDGGTSIREAVHRPEQFCRLTGAAPTDPVRAENLASLILGEGLGDTIFINQAESGEALREARRLAALLPLPLFAGALQRGEWTCLS